MINLIQQRYCTRENLVASRLNALMDLYVMMTKSLSTLTSLYTAYILASR